MSKFRGLLSRFRDKEEFYFYDKFTPVNPGFPTPSPTGNPVTPSVTPSNTPTPSITPSNTPTPSITPSNTPPNTPLPSATPTPSPSNPGSADTWFTFEVDTTLTDINSTVSGRYRLPHLGNTGVQFDVDWGDGSAIERYYTQQATDTVHIYSVASTYTIKLRAVNKSLKQIQFNRHDGDTSNDAVKLINVLNWGNASRTVSENYVHYSNNLSSIFKDCVNLVSLPSGQPDFVVDTTLPSGSQNASMVEWFENCDSLTHDITGWDVSNVQNFFKTFANTSFNQDIGSWNMSSATETDFMFYNNPSFNQDIGSWNMSSVTNVQSMFSGATAFNNGTNVNDIDDWDISSIVDFRNMFKGATSFNRTIGSWDFNNGGTVQATGMLDDCGMSQSNYDATLISWGALPNPAQNITIGVNGLTYTNSGSVLTARVTLITTYGWTFVGDTGI